MLQKELEEDRENLRKKEKKIYEYKYKINDLQKAKHVLSFRTTEMRKSLEPKEAQIEKLKEELFKLENEFEGMLKNCHDQNEELKRRDDELKTLHNNLKIQIETTKKKESLINKITMEIFNTINYKDQKEWVNDLKKMYQEYVQKENVTQTKHDPRGNFS